MQVTPAIAETSAKGIEGIKDTISNIHSSPDQQGEEEEEEEDGGFAELAPSPLGPLTGSLA